MASEQELVSQLRTVCTEINGEFVAPTEGSAICDTDNINLLTIGGNTSIERELPGGEQISASFTNTEKIQFTDKNQRAGDFDAVSVRDEGGTLAIFEGDDY